MSTVDVRPTVLVHRTPAEVAAYMFEPAHDLEWTGGITSSRPDQPGPLREGRTVVRTARFLGRTFARRCAAASPRTWPGSRLGSNPEAGGDIDVAHGPPVAGWSP